MTAPQQPGTPTLPVASRQGNVYLSDENGRTVEVAPDDAVEMLRRGWQPTETGMARAIRAEQIPREAAAALPDANKLGYGVLRGVATPLVDLALPEGNRVYDLLAEDSPWLVRGGEAAGMLGGALLGAGPVGAIDAAGQAGARALGAGTGLLRTAFARTAQGAVEGGIYGAMNSVAEAHNENVPLTAQRLASEIVPGMLFGGVLGGGLGAVEGALGKLGGRTITQALGEADKGKLDEIFRAGVSDKDALAMAKRFGVEDPTFFQRVQAAANPEVSAERRAIMADSGPVGERARADAFMSDDALLQARGNLVKEGDAYLKARDAALEQLQAGVKAHHIDELVGATKASGDDIAVAVREAAMETGDWAADSARREAFVRGALEKMTPEAAETLTRTLGAAKKGAGSIEERLLSGLTTGHQDTIGALEQALQASKLSDDVLKGLTGRQGSWANSPMEFFAQSRDAAGQLAALPRGVNEAPADVRKILGLLQNYEGPVMTGSRAEAAAALDNLKKQLASYAKAGERLGIGDRSASLARDMYENLRVMLEDSTIWGDDFAKFQKEVNSTVHRDMGVASEFDNLFTNRIGRPDEKDPWRSMKVMDDAKTEKALEKMSDPNQLKQLERLREHFDDQRLFMEKALKLKGLDQASRSQIESGLGSLKKMRASLDNAVYLNASQRQARAMLGQSPLAPSFAGRIAVGAVLGGKMGAVAGAFASANPGRLLQMRAIMERMATQTESRVARGIAGLLGMKPGKALAEAGGVVGRAAGKATRGSGKVAALVSSALQERGKTRQQTYERTVAQLVEARQRVPELQQQIQSIMPDLELAFPGTEGEMLGQTQRGLDYVLTHLPVQPQLRLYGTRGAPLDDKSYSDFIRMTAAALDPPSILEMAASGELTPPAVAAAEASAPEFVAYIRQEAARAVTDNPGMVPYTRRVQASLVLGTPLDASLEPDFIALQQATHEARFQKAQEQMDRGGNGGETGLNKRYMSESDRMELDEPPR